MKFLTIIPCLCLITFVLKANDSLYRSDFEQRQIALALKDDDADINYFALYTAIDSDSSEYARYAEKLDGFYFYLEHKDIVNKTSKQKAKLLFKEVHNYFFRKYEENVFFSKIFKDGTYNCVSASMLYAIILTKYDIPFEIKETPTHIYLVAFPGSDNILFETTSPRGFYLPDEKFKREYVAGLVNLKFTTQEYVNQVGQAKAFNEFYYSKESINLAQLAGIQYYNQSITFHQSENTDDAIRSIVKTTLLYPSAKNTFYKISLLGSHLNNSEMDNEQDIIYLCEYANDSKDVKQKKYVLGVFGEMVDDQLIKNSNDTFVLRAYELIMQHLKDEEIKKEITYTHNLAFAHWHAMKSNFDTCLEFAERAYAINTKDVRLQELIVKSTVLKNQKIKGNEKSINELHNYASKYPFLTSNKTFKSLLIFQHTFESQSIGSLGIRMKFVIAQFIVNV